jgi:hypothetical protein
VPSTVAEWERLDWVADEKMCGRRVGQLLRANAIVNNSDDSVFCE